MWSKAALDVLGTFHQRMAEEEVLMRDVDPKDLPQRRNEFLLSVGPEVGHLLHALIVARKATRIIELGTSYGYSTLFLADAARRTGGRVTTFELADYKQASAQESLRKAGLSEYVDWQLGDAVSLLELIPGPIDFVLVDLWKDLYIPCLERFYPKLSDQALIAADNMLEPKFFRRDAAAYQAAVRAKADIQSVLLPVGSGIELSCVWRQNSTEEGS